MPRKRINAGEEQFQLLANQLARANTHYHFAKILHDNRQTLGWAKDFWEYTLTAIVASHSSTFVAFMITTKMALTLLTASNQLTKAL
jgi:hypothetical protein